MLQVHEKINLVLEASSSYKERLGDIKKSKEFDKILEADIIEELRLLDAIYAILHQSGIPKSTTGDIKKVMINSMMFYKEHIKQVFRDFKKQINMREIEFKEIGDKLNKIDETLKCLKDIQIEE